MHSKINSAASVAKKGRIVALTGAGISVDSGIPDFRSKNGLWTRFDPFEYATIEAFRKDPVKVWKMLTEMGSLLTGAMPNPGHLALAGLESANLLGGIVTQNIDGLHQQSGSKNVVEFHGSWRSFTCLYCGDGYELEEVEEMENPPRCECGRYLKPDIVFFGEEIPPLALELSHQMAKGCKAMLVIGTSAEVYPANEIPRIAKRAGATIIEMNLEPTQLTDHVTDIFIEGNASKTLPALVAAIGL